MAKNDAMASKWYQKIGNKIIIVAILASVLPLILLGTTIALKVRNDLVRQVVVVQKARTEQLLHSIDSLLGNYKSSLQRLTRQPDIQAMVAARHESILSDFIEQHPFFFSCSIYRADRAVTVAMVRNLKDLPDGQAPEGQFSDPEYQSVLTETFSKVLQSGKPAFATSWIESFDQKMLFVFVPIFEFADIHAITGVLVASIGLSGPDLHAVVNNLPIEEGDILVLVDKEGELISSQGKFPDGFVGLKAHNWESVTSPFSIRLVDTDYVGIRVPVPSIDGFLLAGTPRHRAFAFLDQLLLDLGVILFVALVLAIGVGYFMSRPLADSIGRLIDAIRQVASGVVSHRLEVEGDDELAEASEAFNEMLGSLEKHRMMDDIWSREWEEADSDDGRVARDE